MKRPEQSLHISIASYLRLMLPHDAMFWHTPNGGYRTKAEGGIFKAMAVRAGFPDFGILYKGEAFFLELKADKRGLSENQINCHSDIFRAGGKVLVARSIEDVSLALRTWRIPLRLSVAA